ncbi:unnamed protein product [Danaus chrysippus]|uniref:(African queen) hypothetical protein n=1 Tax=Danaus chrysippus TaxID=151541 RepID=A0A8J2QVL3_9NEOP|nr:unnamed protein product [Danaus chrysippus]
MSCIRILPVIALFLIQYTTQSELDLDDDVAMIVMKPLALRTNDFINTDEVPIIEGRRRNKKSNNKERKKPSSKNSRRPKKRNSSPKKNNIPDDTVVVVLFSNHIVDNMSGGNINFAVTTLILIQDTEQAESYHRDCLTDNCKESSYFIHEQRIQLPKPPGTYKELPITNRRGELNNVATRSKQTTYIPVLLLSKSLLDGVESRNKKKEVITVIFIEKTQQHEFYYGEHSIEESYKPIYVDFIQESDERSSDHINDVSIRDDLRRRNKLSDKNKKKIPVYIIPQFSIDYIMNEDVNENDIKKSKKQKSSKKLSKPEKNRKLKSCVFLLVNLPTQGSTDLLESSCSQEHCAKYQSSTEELYPVKYEEEDYAMPPYQIRSVIKKHNKGVKKLYKKDVAPKKKLFIPIGVALIIGASNIVTAIIQKS